MEDNKRSNTISIIDAYIKLMEKVHSDYLLIDRIIYKVKNQFRRQKQFKFLVEIRKKLKKLIFDRFLDVLKNNKGNYLLLLLENIYKVLSCIKHMDIFKVNNLQDLIELIEKLGIMIKEMLKLKLYPPYSLIILGILRYINLILVVYIVFLNL